MKKIQVSTVKQTADVQVININAYIIAKAVRTSVQLHNAFDSAIKEEKMPKCDENGCEMTDENGKVLYEKVRDLNCYSLQNNCAEALAAYDNAIAFIDELVAAFEEE